MKKVLKIIVPILLAIAIVAGIGWYLFIYDQDFTRDMLLTTARYFEREGERTIAAWFYDRAYEQGDGSDEVAIELARQYMNSHNYTKAEKTLYRAIKDGGGVDVYVMLSKVFVAQDKLIDAVDLLDDVQDPVIRDALHAMRPAAPVPEQAPGLYNQYLSISISSEGGHLYVNARGEFPSISKDSYSGDIKLHDGENVLYAVTVGDNGLVSPLAILGYTVGGIVQEMEFADAAIAAAVRASLNISETTGVYTNDLWNIKEFTIPADASDFTDLKHMIFLEKLVIHNGKRGNLDILSQLSTLKELEIVDTVVSSDELTLIGSLPNLERLTLDNCSLSTSAGLKGCNKLTYLNLNNNAIRNIQAITEMSALTEVHLQRNALTEVSALAFCSQLTTVDVSYNSLTSIAPLSGLSKLTWLDASGNKIVNLGNISNLAALRYLNLESNSISNISGIAGCEVLEELRISNNQLSDLSALSALKTLTYLDFSHNSVSYLPQWPSDSALVTIDGSYNALTDLSPLGKLNALNNVLMDYNSGIESVTELASCPKLVRVNVYGTEVTDVSALAAQGIIVNYNPIQD